MKFKYKTLIFSIVIIILIITTIFLIKNYMENVKEETAKCQYLNNNRYGKDITFVDCFSIFSIEHTSFWEDGKKLGYYIIRDDKHNNGFAMLKSLNQFKIVGDYLYVYEMLIGKPEGYTRIKYDNGDWQYPRQYYINGEIKEIFYNSPNDFPKYIQVEMSTGEVTLYNTYDQMPEKVKQIFIELENN